MKTPQDGKWEWNLAKLFKTSPNVRLVIDLTAKEYFKPEEVERQGKRYKKIKANMGDRSPSTQAMEEFIETVNEFMENWDGEKEIAVICTYGTNRSGYLICRYLMEMLEMDPEEAIEQFEKARGEYFDPNKPVLKNQLLEGLNHCQEQERVSQMLIDVKRYGS